jgi:ADP-ribose pyrophosphatase
VKPLAPEVVVRRRDIFAGRIVSLRVDQVRLPCGRVTTREVVGHPGAAAIVAVEDDMSVWLARQYRHAVGTVLLEIPAGLREPAEDLDACARRELAEEMGLEAEHLECLVAYHPSAGFSCELVTVYLATGLRRAAHHVPSGEILDRVRLPLERALGLIGSGEVRDGKSIVGLLLARERLGLPAPTRA